MASRDLHSGWAVVCRGKLPERRELHEPIVQRAARGGRAADLAAAVFCLLPPQVDDAVVMYDHENKRPRGFGFITFTGAWRGGVGAG